MSDRLLVTIQTPKNIEAVRATGARVLAEYPNAMLVDVTSEQAGALRAAGLETVPIVRPPVRTASAEYEFEDVRTLESEAPVAVDDKRTAYYLIQLPGPLTDEWLGRIAAAGARVLSTLPGHRFIVGMLPGDAETVRSTEFVDVATYRPAMKVSPHLRLDVDGVRLDPGTLREVGTLGTTGEPEQVQISVFDGESTQEVVTVIERGGGEVLTGDARTVIARVPPDALRQLAELQEVEAILPYEFPMLSNDRAAAVMGVPANRDFGGVTLTGAGQIVGVVDSGLDTGQEATVHPDLLGRVTIVPTPVVEARWISAGPSRDPCPADPHGHGTHVAGSIAGNSTAAEAAGSPVRPSGIAPEASLHFTAVGHHVDWLPAAPAHLREWGLHGLPQPDPTPLLEVAYAAGARIHANCFGVSNTPGNSKVEGTYDPQARSFDTYTFTHRDALVLCTAGNNGRDTNGDGAIDADSIGSPGTAKNVLTVGACQNGRPTPALSLADPDRVSGDPDAMARFSSRGPTDDDRVKPEVVAPATNVLSTLTQRFDRSLLDARDGQEPLWGLMDPSEPLAGWYCWGGGTSMACPLVAGAAALIREYLVVHRGHVRDGVAPSGALLKAYLVNGAVPMNTAAISAVANNDNGFGRVDVANSLTPGALGRTAFSDDPRLAVASLQTRIFTFQVVDPGDPLRVTLCWTDPPSPPGGDLQNELYLRVQPPGGVAAVDGDVTAYNRVTNPTQRVVIATPVAGTYEIQVHGVDVSIPSAGAGAPAGTVQDFAVVASNATTLTTVQ